MFLILSFLFIAGCGLRQFEKERDEAGLRFLQNSIWEIRNYIAKNHVFNNSEDIDYVLTTVPKTYLYMLSKQVGDFTWSWELSGNRTFNISYSGDIELFDTANISYEIRNK
jgi:hypothetical protein